MTISTDSSSTTTFRDVALAARDAAATLTTATRAEKDAALLLIADALEAKTADIVAANAIDIERARMNGTSEALVDRLTLTASRIAAIADAVRDVAKLP
ncbi:MAG: hypothetical protein WA988_15325, partial [Candidatus Nanopelagicales bacterium]